MTPPLRINRFAWLIAAVILVALLLYMIRGGLFPFVFGGIMAYILHPLVELVEKIQPWKNARPLLTRTLSIFIVFALVIGLVAWALVIIIPTAFEQVGIFLDSLPTLIANARTTVEQFMERFSASVPEAIRLQVQGAFENAGAILVGAGQNVLTKTLGAASQALTLVIGLAAVPLLLYYALKDREEVVQGLVALFPPRSRFHVRNVITILNHVFSSYVRAQLFLGVVVGVLVYIGLLILRVQFAGVLAITAGLFELIPIIGPWLGAIPGAVVVLATSPEKILWVTGLYFGVQLLENSILVPRIQSQALHVHPIMIIFALLAGSELAGLWGVVLGPPLAVAAKEVYTYFSVEWHSEEGRPLTEAERHIEEVLAFERPVSGPVDASPPSEDAPEPDVENTGPIRQSGDDDSD